MLLEAIREQRHSTSCAIQTHCKTSYAQLNALIDQVTAEVQELGIGRGDLVLCCLEPTLESVVMILALFSIKAVYYPLCPLTISQERTLHTLNSLDEQAFLIMEKTRVFWIHVGL